MKTKIKKSKKAKNSLVAAFLKKNEEQKVEDNMTLTENDALTFKSTLSPVLDLFAMGGALRERADSEIEGMFKNAFLADQTLALKTLFYLRDVRGGQGERRTFRIAMKWLANNHPIVAAKQLTHIPNYGRYDDLLSLLGTPLENAVVSLVQRQLKDDVLACKKEKGISLLAKWLPSENASSASTKANAALIRSKLGLTPKQYRKTLSALRSYINLVESSMCSKEWDEIDYEKVPSRASMIYRKAFSRHDADRYVKYLKDVQAGKKEIKAGTLYPHDLLRALWKGTGMNQTLNLQWKALPDYLKGSEASAIVVADVSGSMTSNDALPLSISIGLALYFSERNHGAFRDMFITFSEKPSLQKVTGTTLEERSNSVQTSDWGMNTNLQASFQLILDLAVANRVPQKDLPNVVFVVSDMEFDNCGMGTNLDAIRAKYKVAGYETPKLVFWNVNSRKANVAATKNDKDVILISGCSPSILKSVMSLSNFSPWAAFKDTILTERYKSIKA